MQVIAVPACVPAAGILCLETTLDGNRGVTFPESAAVPVALQPRPTWRGGAPRRVSNSVGDGGATWRTDRLERAGAPAPIGLKCKRLSNLFCPWSFSTPPGQEVWTSRMDVTRSVGG